MPKLVKREAILAKVESSYGVDASPSASTDAILVENLGWSYAGARMVERAPVKPTLGMFQGIFAGTLMEITFDVEVKGSGTAGTAPEVSPLLRACGMAETINAGTDVEYAPASAALESATIHYYEDGSLYVLTGCRGTYSLALTVGEVAKFSFTLTGHVSGPTDSALPSPSYDDTVPPPVLNMPFTAGGYAAAINALSLEIGNQIATPSSMTSADGYGDVIITDRDVTGSFDPEATLVATNDWTGDWKDGTTVAIESGTLGSTAGNRFAMSISEAWYKELAPGDRDGLRTYEIGFGAAGDDSAFTLTFS